MSEIKAVKLSHLEALAERVKAKAAVYSVEKQATAETGYFATYALTKDGVQVGAKINIPRDFLVKDASIETVQTADEPYSGAVVGDKYIDFVVNAKEGAQEASHVYLPVNELVDTYTAGNGIAISAQNDVSITLDTANANGLAVSASGLSMATATDSNPGAMSAADHARLSSLSTVAASSTNGNILLDGVETTVYTLPATVVQTSDFATDQEVEDMLDNVFGPVETSSGT